MSDPRSGTLVIDSTAWTRTTVVGGSDAEVRGDMHAPCA
jgi:hypothetical protein